MKNELQNSKKYSFINILVIEIQKSVKAIILNQSQFNFLFLDIFCEKRLKKAFPYDVIQLKSYEKFIFL